MNLPFTMSPAEAAECAKAFRPRIAYPYHYFESDPTRSASQPTARLGSPTWGWCAAFERIFRAPSVNGMDHPRPRLTPRALRAPTFAAASLVLACRADRPFRTVAVYEAPRGQCSIRMEGQGVVRGGADLSEDSGATLTVRATEERNRVGREVASLSVAFHEETLQFGAGAETQVAWHEPGRMALSGLMSDAGCSVVPEELEELLTAVYGVLLGPKGS
jgi:hypothetical protein